MWFDLEMSDLAFIDSAKFRFENKVSLSAPPDKVFEVFADCSSWSKWFPDVVSAKWETDPPHGLGSRRIAKLKTLTAREEFIAWEPGKRFTFTVYALSVPLVRRMVEDYQLVADGDGGSILQWNVFYEPLWFLRPFNALIGPVFRRMFRRALKGLSEYVVSI